MLLRYQLLIHAILSTLSSPSDILSYETVRRSLEKTRSGSSLIAGIERTLRANFKNTRNRFCCSSSNHHCRDVNPWISYESSEQ
ncbi:hypothetical protein K469DRAFT_787709 [Zopfia rhizophila CBS 207.26]|uniref:Secreted protein n=1 Tax=Zopfia rhizophila CBS 207.26 TaxID=1314779 RepID=A0A6A6DV38_9PEZI|nr:hypothetical protein K469DRAFT_787709 [Zopfia rhizophila CBS 207.26]